jgi:CBS domain-containing protein
VIAIRLTDRQEQIVRIVKEHGPIKGEEIADILGYVKATLRPDLTVLTRAGLLEARPRVGYSYSGKGLASRLYEEINKIKVKDMKAVPAVVSEISTVYDAIVTLFVMDVGSLFVVSEGGLLEGVVSRKDLLKVSLGQVEIQKVPVSVVMTRMPNIVMTTPEESLWAAAKKMVDHEIDSLPVVRPAYNEGRQGFEVIGRITKTTITRAFVELGQGKFMEGGEML